MIKYAWCGEGKFSLRENKFIKIFRKKIKTMRKSKKFLVYIGESAFNDLKRRSKW